MHPLVTKSVLFTYRAFRRTGILEHPLFHKLYMAAYFRYKKYSEDLLYPLSRRHPSLFKNGHSLDVGANVGYTALVLSEAIDERYRVFAFEPEESNYKHLQGLFENNPRVETVQCAVGDNDGFIDIWLNEDNPSDHRVLTDPFRKFLGHEAKFCKTPVTKLDTFARERGILDSVGFIKVDVQGYELPVCLGMTEVLERSPGPHVALEYAPEVFEQLGFGTGDLLEFMTAHDYVPHMIHRDGRLDKTDPSTLERMIQGANYRDVLFLKKGLDA